MGGTRSGGLPRTTSPRAVIGRKRYDAEPVTFADRGDVGLRAHYAGLTVPGGAPLLTQRVSAAKYALQQLKAVAAGHTFGTSSPSMHGMTAPTGIFVDDKKSHVIDSDAMSPTEPTRSTPATPTSRGFLSTHGWTLLGRGSRQSSEELVPLKDRGGEAGTGTGFALAKAHIHSLPPSVVECAAAGSRGEVAEIVEAAITANRERTSEEDRQLRADARLVREARSDAYKAEYTG
ncbi:hypothetical protein CYMTET_9398 [Cymbomonas tetramitiformis]|uniref:Uncharacterized protein n=1 Tax=Cymbomonas tetramitiformis TaxID=36881 RepID=A0AAE0LEX2_9CHLO|nr:hypothetical protein CYMTET_9398 [Cymbomonas tetramitiformis]